MTIKLPLAEAALTQSRIWPHLLPTMLERVRAHGDAPRWEAALADLPELPIQPRRTQGIGTKDPDPALDSDSQTSLITALQGLHPWRKGPWWLNGVHIDTEWRSDWKWQRLLPHLPELRGTRILDVGGGNGYYGWQMLNAGALEVVGIDPTILFLYQHLAVNQYLASLYSNSSHNVLPLKLEDLAAPEPGEAFDVVFSMGVLYHRRDPLAHLKELRAQLRRGGTLVLETLVCENEDLTPSDRYARMRNVHLVPQPARVSDWLDTLGFTQTGVCDLNTTTLTEQRSTAWMTFDSLANALDPSDSSRTVEGHPAPVRACFVAHYEA